MDGVLLEALLEGSSLVVFVIFVIYTARSQRQERKELTEAMIEMVKSQENHADEQMKVGLNSVDRVNGNLIELTKANAELSKAIAMHDQQSTHQFDQVIKTLDKIVEGEIDGKP